VVTGWLAEVAAQLPNAPAAQQQIVVDAVGHGVEAHLGYEQAGTAQQSIAHVETPETGRSDRTAY